MFIHKSNGAFNTALNDAFRLTTMTKTALGSADVPTDERPIDRLIRWGKEAGMKQTALARFLELENPQMITNWKRRGMPAAQHAAIARKFGRTVDQLLGTAEIDEVRETGSKWKRELKRVPVVGTAQLGTEGYWLETEHSPGVGDGYIDLPSRDPNAYALRVVGESMRPRIKSGDYVVVHPNTPYSADDEVLVVTRDGRCMVKVFVYRRDGVVALNSVNDGHGRITLREDEIDKIHYVAAIARPGLFSPT